MNMKDLFEDSVTDNFHFLKVPENLGTDWKVVILLYLFFIYFIQFLCICSSFGKLLTLSNKSNHFIQNISTLPVWWQGYSEAMNSKCLWEH